jgi:hydrogenase/urease accessory protein HupE
MKGVIRCMREILRLLPALVGALLLGGPAIAHEVRPAYLQIEEIAPNRFDVLWKQPNQGTATLYLVPKVSNGLLDSPPNERYSANSFVIRKWQGRALTREAFDGAMVHVEGLEHTLTDALVMIRFADGQQVQALLRSGNPALVIRLTGTGKIPIAAYLTLGIKHILTGFDHLSFVLCLVLLVCGRLTLLKTVTAFTIAHSITLAAAALGYIHVNPPLIESLVALSIVFVAVELCRSWKGYQGITTGYPWVIAFSFGLLHGFAFAGSLADIGLPPHNIPAALLLFNCGVEIGQLLFVAVVLGLIAVLQRLPRLSPSSSSRWLVPYGVGTLASYWLFERVTLLAF